MLPKVHIHEDIVQFLVDQWTDTIVVKLLSRSIGCKARLTKLKSQWKPQGGMDLVDLGYGFFLSCLHSTVNQKCAHEDGSWMIYDLYLSVSCWNSDFIPSKSMISTTIVWVCFPKINMLYYNESVLKAIASTIRKPIKVDNNTLEAF
ncbi:hypothetical protein L6164_023604 [Bauhinia variegata]|uniref:Uncharacterized protein n=1 Tax=Bauhinia variegata TaxID=167791 RepID=A0ACB9MJ50_BAUVA|nr:hypothetical protein L6164_023604 [Bauhinia variegata]